MNTALLRTGLFFLFIIVSGLWLSRSGKPYSTLILTVHKLIGLGAGIFLIMTVYRTQQKNSFSSVGIIAISITVLVFIGLVVTGGLISTEKEMPGFVEKIHTYLPYLTVLSTATMIYLLFV